MTPTRLVLAALVGATVPAAADDRSWTYFVDGGSAYLNYGTPQSDDMVIAFVCEPRRGTWRVSAFLDSTGITPGGPARLTLSAANRSVTLAGRGRRNEMDGIVDVVVRGPIDAAALAVLAEAAPLIVAVPGDSVRIEPATMGDKAARFAAACRKK